MLDCPLGPYKGGLRFYPNVDAGEIKLLGYGQTFKSRFTGRPNVVSKGDANCKSKDRSEAEIMRFCQSFMNTRLSRARCKRGRVHARCRRHDRARTRAGQQRLGGG
ncbi:MAG: hypothetical protein KDI22_12275 [Gammaproteobacteria bacterium]|nr:hypothetical protein [Xanthomonadales bacterium]MCB1728193.1 hypothetical protein [Gammaproteobacteria bacterium]MCW5585148.1 hypothetical protein [Chromatiales bacterium]